MTIRHSASAAKFAALFFALFFGSLTWFAASTSAAPSAPVPCAPGAADCYAAVSDQALPAATDAPADVPASQPLEGAAR